jgi:hypothetical protein
VWMVNKDEAFRRADPGNYRLRQILQRFSEVRDLGAVRALSSASESLESEKPSFGSPLQYCAYSLGNSTFAK